MGRAMREFGPVNESMRRTMLRVQGLRQQEEQARVAQAQADARIRLAEQAFGLQQQQFSWGQWKDTFNAVLGLDERRYQRGQDTIRNERLEAADARADRAEERLGRQQTFNFMDRIFQRGMDVQEAKRRNVQDEREWRAREAAREFDQVQQMRLYTESSGPNAPAMTGMSVMDMLSEIEATNSAVYGQLKSRLDTLVGGEFTPEAFDALEDFSGKAVSYSDVLRERNDVWQGQIDAMVRDSQSEMEMTAAQVRERTQNPVVANGIDNLVQGVQAGMNSVAMMEPGVLRPRRAQDLLDGMSLTFENGIAVESQRQVWLDQMDVKLREMAENPASWDMRDPKAYQKATSAFIEMQYAQNPYVPGVKGAGKTPREVYDAFLIAADPQAAAANARGYAEGLRDAGVSGEAQPPVPAVGGGAVDPQVVKSHTPTVPDPSGWGEFLAGMNLTQAQFLEMPVEERERIFSEFSAVLEARRQEEEESMRLFEENQRALRDFQRRGTGIRY